MTTTTSPAPGPGGDLGWQLGTLLVRWRSAVEHAVADIPAGARGYHLLRVVADADTPPTQAGLAAHLGIDRTVMTYLLDDLCGAGLVERCPDPADRRVRRIAATREGRAMLARAERAVTAAEDDVLADLSPAERVTLRALLAHAAGASSPGEDRCAVVTG